ncbi:pantetheine-phosphate adenylyltransferase [Olivibacter sitiensis]|uniref:pantetheine-phosphate adenylyltransferase n=1 Tax=Olivibacter sitiensis TaxID=376470 RepID=UPI00040DBA0B|nr:pantetheine-phosphate adenylyltransferase [Olivibacter sitiensis]
MSQKRIAIFPGSFDPLTLAHFELLNRAVPLFDHIYVSIGTNSSKSPFFSIDDRLLMLKRIFANHPSIHVETYSGLTVHYAKEKNAKYILRGMRNTNDFEFENAIAQNNLQLDNEIESIFLLSSPGYGHISSTIVRDILKNNGDVSHLVPKEVLEYIQKT